MACCLDISDVELIYNRRSGYDVIFTLQNSEDFNPREGDYYTIEDDIATLHKVVSPSGVSDDTSGSVSDDTGGSISAI